MIPVEPNSPTTTVEGPILGRRSGPESRALKYLTMTVREFRKCLHEQRLDAIRAEVLAEKKKPPTSEKAVPKVPPKKT
jgi:hypothetical protein